MMDTPYAFIMTKTKDNNGRNQVNVVPITIKLHTFQYDQKNYQKITIWPATGRVNDIVPIVVSN